MGKIPKKTQQLFELWGRRGGKVRAQNLTSHERSNIASSAACARWNKPLLPSIRLGSTELNDPVYLEEILSDGTWKNWKELYRSISNQPFGDTAVALEKVCSAVKIYGVAVLWQGILRSIRGGLL